MNDVLENWTLETNKLRSDFVYREGSDFEECCPVQYVIEHKTSLLPDFVESYWMSYRHENGFALQLFEGTLPECLKSCNKDIAELIKHPYEKSTLGDFNEE